MIICVVSLMMPKNYKEYENIQESFNDSYQIKFIKNNYSYYFEKESNDYKKIIAIINKMLDNSHQMPALSISIDSETKKEIKTGLWLEFYYKETKTNNELPFDSLLIEINKDYYGFNIIRKYNNKYDGRCFYISLTNTNMNELYYYLYNI